MDYTLDDKQLDGFMFDNSSSMDLSSQYFTVLQLLRTAVQWVEKDLNDWETAWPSYEEGVRSLLERFQFGWEEMGVWDNVRVNLSRLIQTQTEELKTRMERNSEEVASLRNGVCHSYFHPPYSQYKHAE